MRIFWDAMPPTQPPQPPHRVELSTHLTCNLLDLYYSGMINFKKHPDDEDLDDAATGGLTNITTGTKFDKAHRPARPAACRHRASTALLRRQMTRINGDRFSGLRVAIEKLLVQLRSRSCLSMARRSFTQISCTCCGMSTRMYALGGRCCQPTRSSRSWQRRRTTPTCP